MYTVRFLAVAALLPFALSAGHLSATTTATTTTTTPTAPPPVSRYLGVGADAAALKRAGVIGDRAGYENDTFLSNEAPMLATWPEGSTDRERDIFQPNRYLPRLQGSAYRVIQGLRSGIVLGIRLIGIKTRPTSALFKPLIPTDVKLVRQLGSRAPLCKGWVFSSPSLSAAAAALGAAGKLTPGPAAVYVHAWWTAPTRVAPGSAYVDLRTSLAGLRC